MVNQVSRIVSVEKTVVQCVYTDRQTDTVYASIAIDKLSHLMLKKIIVCMEYSDSN